MAIDSGDLVKIDSLVINPSLDYNQYIPQAKDAAVPTAVKAETLLRTMVSATIDATGESTFSIPFDTYTVAVVTIDEDCALSVSPKTNETCYIVVNKGANDIVDIYINQFNKAKQVGLTKLLLKVESVNGNVIVSHINNQEIDTLTIGNLTPDTGTITALQVFKSYINNNICFYEIGFSWTPATADNALVLTVANWDVTKLSAYNSPAACYVLNSGNIIPTFANVAPGTIYINFGSSITGSTVITMAGSFMIK